MMAKRLRNNQAGSGPTFISANFLERIRGALPEGVAESADLTVGAESNDESIGNVTTPTRSPRRLVQELVGLVTHHFSQKNAVELTWTPDGLESENFQRTNTAVRRGESRFG